MLTFADMMLYPLTLQTQTSDIKLFCLCSRFQGPGFISANGSIRHLTSAKESLSRLTLSLVILSKRGRLVIGINSSFSWSVVILIQSDKSLINQQ